MSGPGPRYWAVVPAAGRGARMGGETPKQYLKLGQRSVLEHTLDALFACGFIEGVVLALAGNDEYWPDISSRYGDRNLDCVTGGQQRCHSVLNALQHLATRADSRDWVLVHDAARPCVRREDIERLIKNVGVDPDGGLLGLPLADTIKRVDAGNQVTATVERQGLWRALTPQLFSLVLLQAALEQAIADDCLVTDEAAAMERAGYRPQVVRGRADNIKITVPADLGLAGFYLGLRSLS